MLIDSLNNFRKDYPDPLKVSFFMTKFSNNEPYISIFNVLKKIYSENGITLLRADDKIYHSDLFSNIEIYMHSCGSGIAFFDTMENEDFNPNVAFEVGYMMSLNKPICLLKNKHNRNLQSDLMGEIYINLDPFNLDSTLSKPVSSWLRDHELCLTCSDCFITLNEDFFSNGVTQEKFEDINNKITALKRPQQSLSFKGVSRNASENTVFSYECSPDFFESLHDFFKSGALQNSIGQQVLSVSPYKNSGYKNYDYIHNIMMFKPGSPEKEKIVQVCKLSSIKSFEREKAIAEGFFTIKNTTSLNHCEVYVTERNDMFYFQTNFVITGFDYPAKLLVYQDNYNLMEILKMLVSVYYPYQKKTDETLILAHCTKIKYFIDRSMINSQGLFKIDLDGARNIKLVA